MNIIIPQEVNDLLQELEFGTVELEELDVYTVCTDKESGDKVAYTALALDSDDAPMLEWKIENGLNTIYIYDEKWERASLYDLDNDNIKQA